MRNISLIIRQELEKHHDAKKAKWLENYVKHDIKSRGVGIPQIRSIMQNIYKQNKLNELSLSNQKKFLDDLMMRDYTEDKLAAIIYVQLYLKDADVNFQLSMISNWFDKRWVYDWNVCDWLCVRLLSPLVDKYPKHTIAELKKWIKDEYLWKARASLVPFARCKSLNEHIETIDKLSKILIKGEERFCKTAVGWVLRQVSKFNKKFVIDFLVTNKKYATQELTNNAKKYFK